MGKKAGEVQETPQEKAFAEVAMAQMKDYRQRWLPLQRKLGENITAMGAEGSQQRKQAAGKASTDSAIRFGEAKGAVESALSSSSGSVGSSKTKLGIAGMGADEATSRGLGFVAADQAIDDAYLEGLGRITAMGRGERASAISGLGDVAQMSARQAAQDAELSAQRRAGNAQLVGQVAGFGLSAGMNAMGKPPQTPTPSAFGGTPDQFFGPVRFGRA